MTDTNFLGLAIDGDIIRRDPRREQISQDEFAVLVKALLDDSNVVEFGWTQYTPYFNDGDECVFGASGLWVRTTADADVEDHYQMEMWSHPTLSGQRRDGDRRVTYDVQMPETAAAAKALKETVEDGTADVVLLGLFGDHACVTVTRDGISVEYYEHD